MAGDAQKKTELVSQPTSQPTRKVTAAGLAGSLVILIAAGLNWAGVDLVPGVEASMATVLTFIAAYVVKEEK